MKHLKTFEKLIPNSPNCPKINDYVFCHLNELDPYNKKDTNEFLNNNIGKLIKVGTELQNDWIVKFNKPFLGSMSSELYNAFDNHSKTAAFYDDEIDYWSDDEEILLAMKDMKKYNL